MIGVGLLVAVRLGVRSMAEVNTVERHMADLVVDDVALRYGDNEILKGVSVAVPPGTVVALLGPSGSGKTTLLRAVAGLETPHRGTIRLGDTVFFDAAREIELPAEARGLGLVFQSYALWPHRTVFDNVAYGLKLRGFSRARDQDAGREGAGADRACASRRALSAPVVRRPAAARGARARAGLRAADHPARRAAVQSRRQSCAKRRGRGCGSSSRRSGLAALIVTHDQIEAMAIADRITLLNGGVIEQEGIADRPLHGAGDLVRGRVHGQQQPARGHAGGRRRRARGDRGDGRRGSKALRARSAAVGDKATGVIRIERMLIGGGPGPNRIPMKLIDPDVSRRALGAAVSSTTR